ncbi:hypothetical protein [Lutibacter sp.]|uniref:hypothetical protein n=1 Tax=Lutibacter sp. TaxID=1925666 RepID=UPI0034A02455
MKFEKLSTFLLMLFLLSSFASAITTTDLISHYTLDTNASDSHDTNDGTVTGAVFTTGSAGIIDEAIDFDGVNDYLVLPTSLGTDIGTTSVASINFWIEVDNYIANTDHADINSFVSLGRLDSTKSLIYLSYDHRNGATNRLELLIRPTGNSATGAVELNGNENYIPAGQKKMVTIVVNGSNAYLYVNNVLVTSAGGVSVTDFSGVSSFIAKRPDSNAQRYGDIKVDELTYFAKALTNQDRTDLLNGGTGITYPFVSYDNFTITAKDKYDTFIINEFDVDLNGTIYNVTDGQLITPINYTTLVNISISKAGYFEINYTDYNTSTNLIAELPSLVNKEVKIYNDMGNLTSMACIYNDDEYNGSSFNVSTYLVTNLTFFCQQNSLYKSAEITLTDDNLTQNITLVPQSLDITVFNEITLDKIEQDIDVLIQDNSTERNFTLINGTGIITGINETDIYRLVFNTTGYESRVLRFDTSQGFSSQLNIYLQPTTNINVQDVTIRIVDSRGYDIDSARIQIFVYINGTKTKIEDQLTDITGSITAPLDIEKRHFFEISKDNYATRSFVVNNPLTTSYTFSLQDEIQTDFDNELNRILYSYDPGKGVLIYNRSYIFNWSVSSPDNELSSLYASRFIIREYNSSGSLIQTYVNTSTNTGGELLTLSLDLSNKINSTIEFIFCFKKDGYSEYCLAKKLLVLGERDRVDNLYGIRDLVEEQYSDGQRVVMWLFAWIATSIILAAVPFMRNVFIIFPIMLFGLFFAWLFLPITYLGIIGLFFVLAVAVIISRSQI